MKPVTAVITACLLVTAACSGQPEAAAPATPLSYEADGIAFTYPSNWELLTGLTTAGGSLADGPVVGFLDGAGNLIGLAIRTQRIDPPVPPGEERSYLTAVFSRHSEQIWEGGMVREGAWDFIEDGIDGRLTLHAVIDSNARDEPLTSAVLAAVDGPTLVIVQCQAPMAVFDLLEPRCASVVDALRIEWSHPDSEGAGRS